MFFLNILSITLLAKDRIPAIPGVIGKIIKPIPVIGRVEEIEVAPKKTFVSTDSKIVFRIL